MWGQNTSEGRWEVFRRTTVAARPSHRTIAGPAAASLPQRDKLTHDNA